MIVAFDIEPIEAPGIGLPAGIGTRCDEASHLGSMLPIGLCRKAMMSSSAGLVAVSTSASSAELISSTPTPPSAGLSRAG